MNDEMEINDFKSRWYDKAEKDMIPFKVQAVLSANIPYGWAEYKKPTITGNAQDQLQVTIHMQRPKNYTNTR